MWIIIGMHHSTWGEHLGEKTLHPLYEPKKKQTTNKQTFPQFPEKQTNKQKIYPLTVKPLNFARDSISLIFASDEDSQNYIRESLNFTLTVTVKLLDSQN